MSAKNDTALASEALRRALVARRPDVGLLHHTDRGSPYAALAYTNILRQYGIVASMSRAGDCYDNAVVESFFGTLKAELVGDSVYPSRAVAAAMISDCSGRDGPHRAAPRTEPGVRFSRTGLPPWVNGERNLTVGHG